MNESDATARQDEAGTLAQIGRCLFGQNLRVKVELPRALATAAQAAWNRDDYGDGGDDDIEPQSARQIRYQAGALALIGLAVVAQGLPAEGDPVEVELDAWQVGSALDAADQRGLLPGLGRDPSA